MVHSVVFFIVGNGINREAFIYYYHPDHLGSSSYITDINGEVTQHVEYFAFGETFLEEHSNTDRTPYLFNAKELDEETGLYYYGARYYDAKTSVWQSVDPLAEKTMTPYQYVTQNPVTMIDPDGKEEKPNSYKGELGKGDWREDDRILGNGVFNKANTYNIKQEKGFKEYKTIEQRAAVYKWFQNKTDSEGYETNWAGAAFVVASQMSNIHSPFAALIDNDIESDVKSFAEEGNKAIFENVYGRLKDLIEGPALKGEKASNWDSNTLTIEQRDIVGPIYNKQRPEVLNELSKMAKGDGMYSLGVPNSLRFSQSGNVRDWKQRYSHGMKVALPYWNKVYSKRSK